MKKFINDPDSFSREALEGLVLSHPDILSLGANAGYVKRRHTASGKVALVSGGGAGHEPLHAGFVGRGMLDAACPGKVFSSPTPDQIATAIRDADNGRGVLLIVKNYAGDVMNFTMAAEMFDKKEVAIIRVADEATGEPTGNCDNRRGLAGTVIVEKMLGAAAERGLAMPELVALGERLGSNLKSMGIALSSCVVPSFGSTMFDIGDQNVEIGVGIHGERGRSQGWLKSADALIAEMIEPILAEFGILPHPQRCLLMVNGLGGTPPAELSLVARAATMSLQRLGYVPHRFLVGNYATSLDAAGCSITLCLLNDELTALWDDPVHTAALRWGL